VPLNLTVGDYPWREWNDTADTTVTGYTKFTLQITRDDPNAVKLRICNGTYCTDVDISDINLGDTATKTAQVECCTGAGTISAQKNTILIPQGSSYTLTAPNGYVRAVKVYGLVQADPGGFVSALVILPGKSVTFSVPANAESEGQLEYYDIPESDLAVTATYVFKLLDANDNELDSTSVNITDIRPFAVASYTGNVDVTITEIT